MVSAAPIDLQDLAAACVRYVSKAVGIELDFTPDTLPLLDHYLSSLEARPEPEVLALIVPAAGAYFGEVVARALGPARWHTSGEDYARYRLELERCFLHFNPMGQALEAILGRPAEGWGANLELGAQDARTVEAGLERLGDVRADDYYRLSVRFEVLEQVVTTLVSQALTRGEAERRYSADDYATAIAEAAAADNNNLPN